jgi:hypothetical protein
VRNDPLSILRPLGLMEMTRRQMTNAPAGERTGFGLAGEFAHIRQVPPAEFRAVVRPNFDTLYSVDHRRHMRQRHVSARFK